MSDSANHKNILAIQEYSKETRKMLRDYERKNKQIDALRLELNMLKNQVQTLFKRL